MVTVIKLRSDWLRLILTVACVSFHHGYCATQAEERSSEKVKIKVYDLSTSEWTTSKRSEFSNIIGTKATDYCTNSPSSCELDSAATFTANEVGLSGADKDGASIEFTFYIDFPSGASVSAGGATAHVVPKSAAQAIAAASRNDVKNAIDKYITYIDDEYYSVPPNTDTNRVIIPIAFVVVFLLCITVIALHFHQKNKERKEKIADRLQRKKRHELGVTSSYSALDTTTTTILTANNSTTPRRGITNNNNNNNNNIGMTNSHMKFSTKDRRDQSVEHDQTGPVVVSLAKTSPNRRSRPSSSVNDFHDGQVVFGQTGEKNTALEPLSVVETLEDDEARRERKRRRKEKRRERKRREEDEESGDRVLEVSYENPVFNSSNQSEGTYSFH